MATALTEDETSTKVVEAFSNKSANWCIYFLNTTSNSYNTTSPIQCGTTPELSVCVSPPIHLGKKGVVNGVRYREIPAFRMKGCQHFRRLLINILV